MVESDEVQFVVCGCCGFFMAFGGYDICCDECGECDWIPADDRGNILDQSSPTNP